MKKSFFLIGFSAIKPQNYDQNDTIVLFSLSIPKKNSSVLGFLSEWLRPNYRHSDQASSLDYP